jgi:hypothetical protein
MYDPEGLVEKTGDALGVVSVGWKAISNDSKSSLRIGVKKPERGEALFANKVRFCYRDKFRRKTWLPKRARNAV